MDAIGGDNSPETLTDLATNGTHGVLGDFVPGVDEDGLEVVDTPPGASPRLLLEEGPHGEVEGVAVGRGRG